MIFLPLNTNDLICKVTFVHLIRLKMRLIITNDIYIAHELIRLQIRLQIRRVFLFWILCLES